jgi:hypothetical protein
MKRAYLFFLAAAAFIFTGCFDMSMDVWVKTNNSGRLTVGLGMEEFFANTELENGKTVADNLKEQLLQGARDEFKDVIFNRTNIHEYYEDGKYFVALDADVRGIMGSELTRLSNGNYRLDWLFGNDDQAIPEDQIWLFWGRYLTIRLHGERVVSANGRISGDMKSVSWRYPLTEAFKIGFSKRLLADIRPLVL